MNENIGTSSASASGSITTGVHMPSIAADPLVELIKPTAEHNSRRYDDELERYVGESFDRGERIIMVDGVRWGRTFVTHHGMHGTTHVFKQENGDILAEDHNEGSRIREVKVHSLNKRKPWRNDGQPYRSTEELVLDKARELVATGKLKHPDVVQAENARAAERYRANCEAAEAERKAEFRQRACEALGINQDDGSEIIDRVVAAMEWAQTK